MKTIYKYTLDIVEMQDVNLPADAEILTVQNQNEKICMWVRLDPIAPKVCRSFAIFGTGWDIISNADFKYLGTVQLEFGELVFHVFEWLMRVGNE